MPKRHFSLADADVLGVLSGLFVSGAHAKHFLRVNPDGTHQFVAATSPLVALGMCKSVASRFLREAVKTGLIPKLPRWSIESPEIKAMFDGLHVSSVGTYFRLDQDGGHRREPMGTKLQSLGMSNHVSRDLLRAGLEAGLIVRLEYAPPATNHPVRRRLAVSHEGDDEPDEEDDEDTAPARKANTNPIGLGDCDPDQLHRYELVYRPSSKFYGYFDSTIGIEVMVSDDKQEVLEKIFAMIRGQEDSQIRWYAAPYRAAA